MAYQLFTMPKAAPPLEGGWSVQFFLTGTTTETDTYTTSALSVAHTNPVEANAGGVLPVIYLDPAIVYKCSVFDADGVLQYTADPCNDKLVTQASVGETLYPRTDAEISAGVTPVNYAYPPGCFNRYENNASPGTTDMTAAIQAAMNSNARAYGNPGETYLVSHQGTFDVNSNAYRYCLLCPSNVTLDLNGSTIKLANSQNSSIVASTGTTAPAIINGTLDGNKANQTAPGTGEIAQVMLYDVDRPNVVGIVAQNNRQYAGRFLDCRDVEFDWLTCLDSYGDGWSFGTTGAVEFRVVGGRIDNVYAQDCEGAYAGLEGNGAIFTVVNVQVGKVRTVDCGGGIKVQNSSDGATFESLVFDGDDHTHGTVNSGVKVQGFHAGTLYPQDITIGQVRSVNAYGCGLFIDSIDTVRIGSYVGRGNGSGAGATGSDKNDVQINQNNGGPSNTLHIDRIITSDATAIGVLAQGAGRFTFGTIEVVDPGTLGMQIPSSGYVGGDLLTVRGAGDAVYDLYVTGSCKGRINKFVTSQTHRTTQYRVTVAAANYDFEIGSIRLGSTDVLEGAVTLSNTATATAVTCGHIWHHYVGGSGDYFSPLIEVQPINASAMALGQMRGVPTDGSSGTGISLKHASSGATDNVVWRVRGWKVLSIAQA